MSTKVTLFFALCVGFFEAYHMHPAFLRGLLQNPLAVHFPATLNNGQGQVIDTEIGNLNRLTELNRIVVCNLFRVRTVERENSDMIERANQSAATNSMRAAVGEARAEFGPHPVLGDRGSFVVMAIEGTGLRKSLYRCPPFEWRTSGGMETMRDMYITVSDVVANVPLCFEKVDENTVKLTDIGDDIKLHDIPAMMDAVHRTIRYATAR